MSHDQDATIEFLKHAQNYGLNGPVQMLETHLSIVFLVADKAFKLKRAVRLPYADFSTPAARLKFCLKEVKLNSRTAPELYLGVRRITRAEDGGLCFNGSKETIDAVVEMTRFAQEHLFDRMAEASRLTPALMDATARMIAGFHQNMSAVHAGSGSANVEAVLDINRRGFATSHVFSKSEVQTLDDAFRTALEGHRRHLDRRETVGMIRRCHGDLHLRNIYLAKDGPRLFDCIEFNDQIATVDVLYDLAFLLMDLWHRNLHDHANLVMNRYLDTTRDEHGGALLPFFMALRAAVRAHVVATQAEMAAEISNGLQHEARSYFDLAINLLRPPSPILIAIGGLSGSGKSTIAEALAPHVGNPPGAQIFESDRIRKAMFAVAATTRLADDAYRPEISIAVYKGLCDKAGTALSLLVSVIVDAVFDKPSNRAMIERVASALAVPFVGIWLKGEHSILKSRIAARKNSVSDATVEVLEAQETKSLGAIGWRHIDANLSVDAIVELVMKEINTARSRSTSTHTSCPR
jgi:aminoglycoside phosphotransferase family enzyme/predicted kinase